MQILGTICNPTYGKKGKACFYIKLHVPQYFLMEGYGKWEDWKSTATDGLLIRFQLLLVGGQQY